MRKFEQAIQSKSRRNNSTYTDELRITFLVTFLDRAASDFYFQFLDEFLNANGRIHLPKGTRRLASWVPVQAITSTHQLLSQYIQETWTNLAWILHLCTPRWQRVGRWPKRPNSRGILQQFILKPRYQAPSWERYQVQRWKHQRRNKWILYTAHETIGWWSQVDKYRPEAHQFKGEHDSGICSLHNSY